MLFNNTENIIKYATKQIRGNQRLLYMYNSSCIHNYNKAASKNKTWKKTCKKIMRNNLPDSSFCSLSVGVKWKTNNLQYDDDVMIFMSFIQVLQNKLQPSLNHSLNLLFSLFLKLNTYWIQRRIQDFHLGGQKITMCPHAHYERKTELTFSRGPGPKRPLEALGLF